MFGRRRNIVCLLIGLMAGLCGCSSRALDEAQAVVAQADSLWHIGQIYGIDEGDSATLAQAYETLKKQSAFPFLPPFNFQFSPFNIHFSPFNFHFSPFNFQHSCYHYGRLLRQKDDPVSAMQVFIDATHSRTRDYHILGRVYSNMGSICHLASEFPLSYDMYERSADCFLKNGDTTAYYFLLNDMAFEKGMSKDLDNCRSIVHLVKKAELYNEHLAASCNRTLAEAFLIVHQYDSALYFAYEALRNNQQQKQEPASQLILAQAYSYMGKNDSAVYYAQQVLEISHALGDINNALYILTNDDKTKDIEGLRQTAADRSDTQKLLEIRQGKMSQAVQLLEQDLTREPDWKWLISIVATIFVISLCLLLYIFRKRRQHKLLSQQVNDLATANAAVKQRHEQLVQDYTIYKQSIVEQIEQNCIILLQAEDFPRNIHWKDYNAMCEIINDDFGQLTTKLQTIYHLSEREIRLCVLVLLGISNSEQLAEMLHYGSSGIRNFKNRTAKKLGTNSIELRKKLLNIAVGELQETGK